jgi:O-antigen/teichoic acid export membrane protein
MTVTSFLFIALVRVEDLIIGRLIGTAAVGVYRTAWRTVDLIAVGVFLPVSPGRVPR